MKKLMLVIITAFFFLSSCAVIPHKKEVLKAVSEEYFSVYATRTDLKRLMSFYAEDAQLFDIIYGNHLEGQKQISDFFAWDQGQFKLIDGNRVLTVTQHIVDKDTVVTEGVFNAFEFNGQTMGPWLFIIIQKFDVNNKIIKQTDWINYTPRSQFLGGKNMNQQ
ncbi:nuclear transport factor 2 family protein [Psychrobium sp. 1_MG-2023]|uniref:nuclear transport factor 2 family protein n=1 Tax=Psychrobium sp. 1_MG-2023 TaxID=3062624 RepID=UPI000CB34775|nr:nuclear transport factor 2 family protein [Psychrobium sp. 1_MG-2023]MDP2562213.1 nuclear transport factor 2 family protein [Psychrobium sp. 1_MG-2023]PKF58085.1 hypothetical protein CW748_04600 [Alteromonadales bacterium alter-6D02]